MKDAVETIQLTRLAAAFIPVGVVLAILYRWSCGSRLAFYAVIRMLAQLLLVGYVLAFIFEADYALTVIAVLTFMLGMASWIALSPVPGQRRLLYTKALASIALGGVTTLLLVTQGVLALEPWFEPRYFVPLSGMIFANAMNTLSLAAERFGAETRGKAPYEEARRAALQAALIPLTNSFFAVGLVSFPGMMTGQILSGVSPLVAARYQIVVMCMVFGSAGISAACFLTLLKPPAHDNRDRQPA